MHNATDPCNRDKYNYLRMPISISGAPDIFQDKMSKSMIHLKFSRVYKDGLLVLTNGSLEDILSRLGKVLEATKGRTEVEFREMEFPY